MPSENDVRLVKIVSALRCASEDELQAVERSLRLRPIEGAAQRAVSAVLDWEKSH